MLVRCYYGSRRNKSIIIINICLFLSYYTTTLIAVQSLIAKENLLNIIYMINADGRNADGRNADGRNADGRNANEIKTSINKQFEVIIAFYGLSCRYSIL